MPIGDSLEGIGRGRDNISDRSRRRRRRRRRRAAAAGASSAARKRPASQGRESPGAVGERKSSSSGKGGSGAGDDGWDERRMQGLAAAVRSSDGAARDTRETRVTPRVSVTLETDGFPRVSPGPARPNPTCRTVLQCFLVSFTGPGFYTLKPAEAL